MSYLESNKEEARYMEKNDIAYIKQEIQVLLGSECIKVGRACNLVWFSFVINGNEFALHIQSSFRITRNESILCANLDMYEPKAETLNNPSFNYEDFKWDIQGNNYFDEWILKSGNELQNERVKNIKISNLGNLVITFENDITLEVFNNSSVSECWRFFKLHSKNHIVVLGNELES